MRVFFFKAEDGIRDYKVTGVQTCALPICITLAGRPGCFCGQSEGAGVSSRLRMTYSLNALTASTSAKGKSRSAARPGMVARFGHEMLLLAGLLALVFWLASMLSYSPQDPAWSTSGAGHARLVANWMGRVGAWLADACYFGFGMSVWWLVLASLQTWLSSFARWLRGGVPRDGVPLPPLWRRRLRFWGGLLLLLGASCALEWTRLYRFESVLPGPAGGVFGYMLGYHSLQWLGFMGSGLIGICVAVIGLAMVFRFSWGHLAESMGARLDGWVLFLFARREKARDEAAGRRAAREREEVVQEERTESAVQHPQPVQIIEPVLQEAALPSVRVVKERQKPLFSELPDSKLPQVDLLDAAQQRQESVSPETLEMTSRLIEKRLKDFGVDGHVVAAIPGPVITRYEIEPATGVKGSQIVNLAKDLARSLSLDRKSVV